MIDVIEVPGPKHDLEQALRHILDVAARSLDNPQPPARRALPVEYLPGGAKTDEALRNLLAHAREEFVDCSADESAGEDRLEAVYHTQVSALERGVACYYLRSPGALRCPRIRAYLRDLRRRGAQVRITDAMTHDLMIVDGRAAAIPVADGPERLLVRAPTMLSCVRAVFQQWWECAFDLPDLQAGAAPPEETLRRVLACLAAGTIDEVGARELGMSVRTYRRNVATLLQRLGAQTRFQAGIRAAQLGWR